MRTRADAVGALLIATTFAGVATLHTGLLSAGFVWVAVIWFGVFVLAALEEAGRR